MPGLADKIEYSDLPTASIKGLEIFSSGKWNGDTYSDADLDAMVSAFNQVGFEPTIKAGHADGQESEREARKVFGAPALGYVERIYRQGSKLLADFKDIPRKFADLIKAGAYKRVSAEVYWNYSKGDEKFPRVLKAVAFLGADIPAITNLKAVENLYKQTESGALYAFDSENNEFRVYNMSTDKEKGEPADDEGAEGEDMKCPKCGHKMSMDESGKKVCKYCAGKSQEGYEEEEDIISYAVVVEAKNYFIRKKGSEWCVMSHAGKQIGCHGTREEALAQLRAVEANKHEVEQKPKQHSQKNVGGLDMTEEEVNALLKKRLDEERQNVYKEFEDRIHKAREEGKEEANKENELLREDIRKLQLEKRSERIEHWIKGMKEKGKILPPEESMVRSLRQWMPDEGPDLKYFAMKDGQTKEFSAGPAEMFEEFIAKRQSVFTNYSRGENPDDDDAGQELPDPSAEVDRRAKQYQDKMQKDGKTVSYKDALTHVLKTNVGLAQRYQDKARPH